MKTRNQAADDQELKAVSVFSGGMGLDLGLEAAGFSVRFASDLDPAAIASIRANRPLLPIYEGDIRSLSGSEILDRAGLTTLDLLAGGPPCQSFSTAGRRLGADCERNGPLVFDFIRLVGELRPRAFVMENVKGIMSAALRWRQLPYNNNGKRVDDQHGTLLRAVLEGFEEIGYSARVMLLNAADYGVPQSRERVFIVGYRDGSEAMPPMPTHTKTGGLLHPRWRTIREAWTDLPDEHSHCAKFSERKLRYLSLVPQGSNWRSLPEELQRESMGKAFFAKGGRTGYWRRLSLDEVAPTVLTEPQNASTSLCHPIEDRPINVREAARLQTFPDTWRFEGSGAQQYRLVGNAVPPILAQAVARTIHDKLHVMDMMELAA